MHTPEEPTPSNKSEDPSINKAVLAEAIQRLAASGAWRSWPPNGSAVTHRTHEDKVKAEVSRKKRKAAKLARRRNRK